jgi:hypothetical protein
LQGALVTLQQRQLLPGKRVIGLQFGDPLVGAVDTVDENLIRLAQPSGIGSHLHQPTFKIGDHGACGRELAAELGVTALQRTRGKLRRRQFMAKRVVVARRFCGPFLKRLAVRTHRFVARAKPGERAAQADIVGYFLLQRPQHGADGLDDVAEGIFDIVERSDPTAGVGQQIPQRLIVGADARAKFGRCRIAACFDVAWILPDGRRRRRS